jgi:hypothetical protein
MKMNPSGWQKQSQAEREPNIHKASFIERRLFYLKIKLLGLSPLQSPDMSLPDFGVCLALGDFSAQLCYKGK